MIWGLAFDPQGTTLASGSGDGTVKLWQLASGKLLRSLGRDQQGAGSVAFGLQGAMLATGHPGNVRLWDASTGKLLRTFKKSASPVAFHPQLEAVASGSGFPESTLALWDVHKGQLLREFEGDAESINCVAFNSAGTILASSGRNGTINLWNPQTGKLLRTLTHAHEDIVVSLAFHPEGAVLASAGFDKTIKLWTAISGKLLRTLEGHTAHIDCAAFSPDGRLLASKSGDNTIRIWSYENGETVAVIPEPSISNYVGLALAFHSSLPLLATAGSGSNESEHERGNLIHVWELDVDGLLGRKGKVESVCYKNAKVVLVGDSGVGKSGLALRMTSGNFEATESTHGRHVWLFDSGEVSLEGGRKQARETLLWDLAGQPGYRLVHQLNIDEAAVALVLIDARNETDPLGPAEFWSKAIDQARSAVPITKILVEARADRGGVAVSPEDLQRFCEKFGFAHWIATSAKTGLGVEELKQVVRAAIPWDELPEVISTKLFTRIRNFLQAEKERGDQVLVEQLTGFRERYIRQTNDDVNEAEFRTVVGRLAASGLAQFLVFTILEEGKETDYVLMQPEYLDAYASAIINQARQDPRGIGHVSEARIHQGELGLAEGERIPDRWAEELVLGEAIEQLLKHDIALRERLPEDHDEAGDFLVLPSQYTRTSPYPGKKLPGVSYEFEGASRAIFATLVVKLAHHRHFAGRDFWRDAASYATAEGKQFIVVLEEPSPSRGRLSVYFDNNPARDEQISFLRYVETHLNGRTVPGSVVAHRENRCPVCSHPWDEAVVQTRLRLGKHDIICPNCETRSPLLDLLLSEEPDLEQISEEAFLIDADAEAGRKRQLAVTAIRGKEQFGEYDVFLSYNSHDRAAVLGVAEMLKRVGIRPWLDVWDLIPGQPWQRQLEQAIGKVKSAAVCVGTSGMGPWQNQEMAAFIRKFVARQAPVMPVVLPGLEKTPDLPTFLEGFMWVDLHDLTDENPRPLANLVAGILGRRPSEIKHDSLADQVAAILRPTQSEVPEAEPPVKLPTIILPVNRPELSDDELDAVVQQTAQLLGISSQSVQLVRKESGSVRLVLQLDDMIALSELFLMAQKGDPNLIKFFDRCQISIAEFQEINEGVRPKLALLRQEEKARQPDELDQRVGMVSPPEGLRAWAGGAKVATIAIVFTDIVDSTKLSYDLGDATWDGFRQLHFAQVQQLIAKSSGCFIKNTGDGILAAFHNADDAVTFSRAVTRNTGHAVIRVRVGVHIGQVTIDGDDTFGRHVNLAARVMSALRHNGIMISDRVKSDIDSRKTDPLSHLRWQPHQNVQLKGIPTPQTLWELLDNH